MAAANSACGGALGFHSLAARTRATFITNYSLGYVATYNHVSYILYISFPQNQIAMYEQVIDLSREAY